MAEQMRPASPEQAPDPARSYERAKPEDEAGMGRLTNNPDAVPEQRRDQMPDAATNAQPPRQINADDETNSRLDPGKADNRPENRMPPPQKVEHSMLEEEPDGWDLAPQDIHNPRERRHPRTEGKGGTP